MLLTAAVSCSKQSLLCRNNRFDARFVRPPLDLADRQWASFFVAFAIRNCRVRVRAGQSDRVGEMRKVGIDEWKGA
jgi:hypothetical protein